jgi:hypothetical protein
MAMLDLAYLHKAAADTLLLLLLWPVMLLLALTLQFDPDDRNGIQASLLPWQ